MMTPTALSQKRTRKVMRRRSLRRGRKTAARSHEIGRYRSRMKMNADEIAERNRLMAEAREASKQAMKVEMGKVREPLWKRIVKGIRRTP
jgi:hypothetical protein